MKYGETIEKLPCEVSFNEVLRKFDAEHGGSATHAWARRVLEDANRFYNGEWHLVELLPENVRHNITLMYHHHHPQGLQGVPLVPKMGATVAETSHRFKTIEKDYQHTNCDCFEHIQRLKNATFNPIFLASAKGDYKIPDQYQTELVKPPDNFLHLDGLHRLVAWDLDERFDQTKNQETPKLRAYVAGPLS